MAEIAVAAATSALGWVVEKLLSQVLKAFRLLKSASSNVRKLHDLLERLEPSVKALGYVSNVNHPAGKWLTELRAQREAARDLANTSSRIAHVVSSCNRVLKLHTTSKRAQEVCNRIRALLTEASTLHWAAHMDFDRILAENDDKIREQFGEVRERDEHLFREVTKLATKEDILHGFSELEQSLTSRTWNGSSASAASDGTLCTDKAYEVPEVKVCFGGDAIADDIRKHLLEGEYSKWVGLWGMGGIGKTFTASRLYHDPEIRKFFRDGIYWVTVSKEQPSPYHLCKTLIEGIGGPASVSEMPKNLDAAKLYLRKLLDQKQVLLILDDVWEDEDGKDVLQHFDLVSEDKNSVILVTTRDKDILGRVGACEVFEIPTLSEEDSWRLFSWHAFQSRGKEISLDLRAVAEDVAKECRGLPLALEVIGSTMGDKRLSADQEATGLTLLRIWRSALGHLKNVSHGKNDYKRLFHRLQWSVDSLQDSRLKDCFFYFAAFPEDAKLSLNELIPVWVAEGLVEDGVNSFFSGEVEAKLLLSCLVAKSMVQKVEDKGWGHQFRVHDVLRDVARHNLKVNGATGEEIPASARDCLYAPGLKLSSLPKEWTRSTAQFKVKRLSMHANDLERFPRPEPFHAPDLRVLILSENCSLKSLCAGFFGELSNLRVLRLCNTCIQSVPGGILRGLSSLVLLDLDWCEYLEEVSDEVNGLRSLENLSLRDCPRLRMLPRVDKLTELKRFQATVPSVHKLTEPMHFAFVPSLALDYKDARTEEEDKGNQTEKDDEGLRLQEGENDEAAQADQAEQGACDRLLFLLPSALRYLELINESNIRETHSVDISCSSALEMLYLSGEWSSISVGIANHHHLKSLWSFNVSGETPVPPLGRFTKLQRLSMRFNTDLGTESYGLKDAFPCLKHLQIFCSSSMRKMFVFHPGTMPKIKFFSLEITKKEHVPHSLTELQSLKTLELQFRTYDPDREDFQLLFSQQHCFPNLKFLNIHISAPRAKCGYDSSDASELLLTHIFERVKGGKLALKSYYGR